jgi:hypothetical protein
LLVAKVIDQFSLCIETSTEEYCQGVNGDVSSFLLPKEGRSEPALMLAELVRTYSICPCWYCQGTIPVRAGFPGLFLLHRDSYQLHNTAGNAPWSSTWSVRVTNLPGITFKGNGKWVGSAGVPAGASLQTVKYQIITEFPDSVLSGYFSSETIV